MFPGLRAHATFVADAKNVSEFSFQKHFASATKFPQMFLGLRDKEAKHLFCFPLVCSPWKHYEQQCFRNSVSSFAGAFKIIQRKTETESHTEVCITKYFIS